MGRFKTPQQKKKESYEQDRVEGWGCPHGKRRNRPIVKALMRRQGRRIADRSVSSQAEQNSIDRSFNRTWPSTVPLPERLERSANGRFQREWHNRFRRGDN